MGKSPGKWIKTILLGKKSSKTNSKGKFVPKATNEKETWIAAKEPTTDLPVDPPLVSEPTPGTTDRNEGITVLEKGITSSTTHDEGGMLLQDQDIGRQETIVYGALDDPERIKLEQAATKAQAAFRGYLARRAFWVLRGIIRLQALVRGHLVRRQAVATLRCMQGIIKFQALVRGRRVKHSDAGLEVHKRRSLGKPLGAKGLHSTSTQISRLSRNAFVCKLLRSSPTGMPLRLQYGPDEPNSAWNWLERWTLSRFWEPLSLSKKALDQKSQSRQATLPNVETEPTKSRRTFRKGPAAHTENGLVHSTSETEKPKRNVKKILSHPVDPVVEHPQSELEKVKRNLRKVSSSMLESTDRQEVDTEKPKRIMKKASNIPASEIAENGTSDSEKMKEDVALPKEPDVETVSIPFVSDEPIAVSHDDHPQIDLPPLENIGPDSGNSIMTDGELIPKEEKISHDNQKTTKRRASFSAKQETPENGSQSTPKVPSYMAATESAKAKLRAQGSPRSAPDLPEKNGFTRRYSLPSSTAGKLNSLSPRTQRPVQTNGKGGTKNDKSLLSSRDGNDKVVQAEWRR